MEEHNICLNVTVPPDEYRQILAPLRQSRALVVVVVDATDIENTIFPDLAELIGTNRPIYVVGNKVDLILKDAEGYLGRVEGSLKEACERSGLLEGNQLKHTCLISAKTGYGVEDLVTRLLKVWSRKGITIHTCVSVVYILGVHITLSVHSGFLTKESMS